MSGEKGGNFTKSFIKIEQLFILNPKNDQKSTLDQITLRLCKLLEKFDGDDIVEFLFNYLFNLTKRMSTFSEVHDDLVLENFDDDGKEDF